MENIDLTNTGFVVLRLALTLGVLLFANYAVKAIVFAYRTRYRYEELPHLPRHWLWGNLVNAGAKLSPAINQHPDYAFEDIWNDLGKPPAYLVDLAPVDRAMLVIADPSIAEAVVQPSPVHKYSTPKSDTVGSLTTLVGDHSLVLIEGEKWRTQRRRFNKGFAPAHLNNLVPLVVSKTRIFLDVIKRYAQSGETMVMRDIASDLTTDVITEVAMEKDFQAQTGPAGKGPKGKFGILTAIATMSSLVPKSGQGLALSALSPTRLLKRWVFDKIYTRAIYSEIISKLPGTKESTVDHKPSRGSSTRAIVHLSLADVDPTPAVLNATISQVKTFLFAGSDTTSTLIQWLAYELSKSYPASPLYSDHYRQIRERLCSEHDEAFGKSDPFAILDILEQSSTNIDEVLGTKIPYTTAFIKETLRLHPPGGSARLVPMAPYDTSYPNNKNQKPYFLDIPAWTNRKTGEHHEAQQIRADGARIYVCHHLVHRNTNIWGPDANTFEPARFLDRSGKAPVDENEAALYTTSTGPKPGLRDESGEQSDLSHPYHISTLPTGSFRPFERGPRNCIGSNLAYLEAKIVLAVIARGFEWQKVGLDGTEPKPGEIKYLGTGKEDVEVGKKKGWEVWSTNIVTSVPVDGMKIKAKLRS